MNDLLDFNQPEEKTGKDFSELVSWWEKKRLLYNGILLICGALNIFLEHRFKTRMILPVLFYGIFANLLYCAGIMLEAWDNYYFKGRLKMSNYRFGLFIIGTLLSALITAIFNNNFYF